MMSSCAWWDPRLLCFEMIMEHLECNLTHNSRGLTWLYQMDIDLQYRSFKGLRARCLRPWLQDGWPLFRLAHTLLPLLTSRPLLALWSSHEHHNIFFLIALITFYTGIGAFLCIYALFGSLMSHGLINSSFSLFFLSSYHRFSSYLIVYILCLYHRVSFYAMSDNFSHFNAWKIVMSLFTPISWTLVRRSLVDKVILLKRVHVHHCLRVYPFHYVFLVEFICWYLKYVQVKEKK